VAGGLSLTVAKLFDTFGPRDPRRKLISLLFQIGKSGENLKMSAGDQLLDLVYISDVVDALVEAGARLSDGRDSGKNTYAVSARERFSLRALADEVAAAMGSPLNIEWGARPYRQREVMLPWEGGMPVPGWQPRISLREGLAHILTEDV
jgi:nucleoside-diphosphate-sugar epimerase